MESEAMTLEPLLLTKAQVGQLAGLGVRSIERLVSMGVLKPVDLAGLRCVRFHRRQVMDWIARGCPGGGRRRKR